mmetsp:Transcript_12504/g.16319  ORF Transcript_12504/g.16319 Transcript_12504/m.16319 type:complete len:231 (-) Transcript_12504:265-957(-)
MTSNGALPSSDASASPFDTAANVSSPGESSAPATQKSTDNVIPTKQIQDGWNKTVAGFGRAWNSTKSATDKFVKDKKLDQKWEAAKTSTVETTRKAGQSVNKSIKGMELDKKWKATMEKSNAMAMKVRASTEQLISKKKTEEPEVTVDIPPSSAPIVYTDLDGNNPNTKISEASTSEPVVAAPVVAAEIKETSSPTKEEDKVETEEIEFSIDDDDDDETEKPKEAQTTTL